MSTVVSVAVLYAPIGSTQVDAVRSPGRGELARVAQWLRLDENQAALARQFCDDYWRAYEAELIGQVREMNVLLPSVYEPAFEEVFREEADEIRALRAEIKVRVEALLENLESILREDQLPRMDRVRNGWERSLWGVKGGIGLPEGNVDVIDLVDELDLSQEEQEAVDAIIADFEPRFVAALKAKGESSIYQYKLWHERVAIGKTLDPREIVDPQISSPAEKEYWDLYRRVGRIVFGYNRNLASLNRGALESLMQVLSSENAAKLERAFLIGSYYGIYPDAASAASLYEAVERTEDVTDDQHEAIVALRAEFERRHERASADMAKSVTRRREAQMHGTFETDQEMMAEWDTLRELGLKREELNARQITLLEPILTPEQFQRLPEWDFEENHRDRPWDMNNESRRKKDGADDK